MLPDTHKVIGLIWLFSFFLCELIPMYVLVSLDPSFAECSNYSLRHIFSSSLCQLAVNQSVISSYVWNWWEHQSIKCYIVHRVFMLFASVPRGISVWLVLCVFLAVDSLGNSPFDLGLKLSTQKRGIMVILICFGYAFRFMKLNSNSLH